ncbi:MAG: ferritin-like domain-containing protein [Deltaproteobacteria bacterium]|nr:ferritin-like domain-containing protein [Myxococcales bacterium]MDP3219037.1 ferritin-like domain-containing protein [Deltaproteobacteria bacterium]
MTTNKSLSRRALLGGVAVTGSALALEACGDDAPPVTANPDIGPLNNLLAAEYGAIVAYNAGIPILEMPPVGDPLAANGPALSVIATAWRAQHREHAAQLVTAITAIGGTPVAESTITFTAPMGFTPSVRNVMVLACNAEKAAAIAYNQSVKTMNSASSRYIAGNIEGAETQHFVILYTLLKQVVAPNPTMLITMINEVAPKSFVASVGGMTNGLSSIADFTYA